MKMLLLLFFCLNQSVISAEKIVISPHTEQINKINFKDFESFISKQSGNGQNFIALKCYTNSEDKYYIGLLHGLIIDNPLKAVVEILDDFGNYAHVFHGVALSRIEKKIDENNLIVHFEDKAPVFFLPNTSYQMFYSIEKKDNQQLYKYHLSNLLKQNDIVFSDGIIFLNEHNGKTYFYEMDFFKAHWGVAEKLAGSKIWSGAIEELLLSDLELKIKVENKSFVLKEIEAQTKKIMIADDIKKCISNSVEDKELIKSFHLIP